MPARGVKGCQAARCDSHVKGTKVMKRYLALAAFSVFGAAGLQTAALADGTYVYSDGSIKDYADVIAVPAPMPVPMKEATWYLRGDVGGSFVGSFDVNTNLIVEFYK